MCLYTLRKRKSTLCDLFRWLHSVCDMIKDTDDAEKCADDGYWCILCRPSDTLPPHLRPTPKAIPPKIESPPRSPGTVSDNFC